MLSADQANVDELQRLHERRKSRGPQDGPGDARILEKAFRQSHERKLFQTHETDLPPLPEQKQTRDVGRLLRKQAEPEGEGQEE